MKEGFEMGEATVPFGSGVSVIYHTEDDKKYVGVLLGRDEDFMYFRTTHTTAVYPAVLDDGGEYLFGRIVDEMKAGEVRKFIRSHGLGNWLSRDEGNLRKRVYGYLVSEYLGNQKGVERFVEITNPVSTAIPLVMIKSMENLDDVLNGHILKELDFPISGEV